MKMLWSPQMKMTAALKSQFLTLRFNSQIFVNRLSFYTKYDEFHKLFSQFGNIKQARLIMDSRTGRTKGYGFVTFEADAQAQNAIKALNGKIVQGRLIFVQSAMNSKTDGKDIPSES